MSKYRKKPVEVDAIKFVFTIEGETELRDFAGPFVGKIYVAKHPGAKPEAHILTLENGEYLTVKHIATEGDFIIKDVQGGFYACKPDIFEMTYEEVK